jgi:PAS domain S-box-containing protein
MAKVLVSSSPGRGSHGSPLSAVNKYEVVYLGQNCMLFADEQARLVRASPAACELLGYSESELLRLGVADIARQGGEWTADEYGRFLTSGSWRGKLELNRKDGSLVCVEAQAFSLEDKQRGRLNVSILTRLDPWERPPTEVVQSSQGN